MDTSYLSSWLAKIQVFIAKVEIWIEHSFGPPLFQEKKLWIFLDEEKWIIVFSLFWISYFSESCDKMPKRSNLKEGWLIWGHSLRRV